jgi:hypothetical protein
LGDVVTAPTQPQATGPSTEVTLAALAAAYTLAIRRIRAAILAAVLRQFRISGSWRDADAKAFASIVPPIVAGGQQAVSVLTSAYLHQYLDLAGRPPAPAEPGRRVPPTPARPSPVRPPPVVVSPKDMSGANVRGGVDPKIVYRRPYVSTWTELAGGAPLQKAVAAGEKRLTDLVHTDLQLSKTHTAQRVISTDDRAVGWRRVPQGDYTCALCLISSTQRYHKEKLAALHPNCDCDIVPIIADHDPGNVIDREFLDAVHAAILRDLGPQYVAKSGRKDNTQARVLDYRDIIIEHIHGEIGPVLGVRGHKFVGPQDIPTFTTQHPVEVQIESATD